MIYGEKRLLLNFTFSLSAEWLGKSFWCENKLLSPGVGICEKFSQRFLSFLFVSFIICRKVGRLLSTSSCILGNFFSTVAGPTRERKWSRKQNFVHEAKFVGWSMGVGRGVRWGVGRDWRENHSGDNQQKANLSTALGDGRASSPFEVLTIRRHRSRFARRTPRARVTAR